MDKEQFINKIKEFNIDITDNMLKQLEMYYELLIKWNEKINLTAITEKKEVYLKHFYDSLTLCRVIDLSKEKTLCDIGTGAGFPGIVLKICFPHLKVTLVDALQKRITFLEEVISKLNLQNIECIHIRAEEYAKENRDIFDVVTARAVAKLNVLLEYSLPLVKPGKYFIALKGNEDISLAKNALKILNSEVIKEDKFTLPIENSNRTIIKIKRLGNISLKYPRKNTEIKKKPL